MTAPIGYALQYRDQLDPMVATELDALVGTYNQALEDVAVSTGAATPAVTTSIADGSVTTSKLANAAVTTPKLADMAVTDAKLALDYVRTHPATLQNSNGGTETTVVSLPITAWPDGDLIAVTVASLEKNHKGSAGTFTAKVNAGTGAQVTIASAITWNDDVNEYQQERMFYLRRVGNDVWVSVPSLPGFDAAQSATKVLGKSTPGAGFSGTVTVELKVTLSATDANFYYHPQAVRARRELVGV